jgi:ubiquinone/menaquinone biosynthesis C-methylase UbiE
MAKSSRPGHHRHDPHDWDSADYVANWAKSQDQREASRQQAFRLLADFIPCDKREAMAILDLGAGYGALTKFLLERFPNARAVCQDGSEEMVKLGKERMKDLAGRFSYVVCDFSRPGWTAFLQGPFDAVVSSIAIHNVNNARVIRRIYEDVYPLVRPGGCLLNFDRHYPPIEEQLSWLRSAGFTGVRCFWQDDMRALFGGFRKKE